MYEHSYPGTPKPAAFVSMTTVCPPDVPATAFYPSNCAVYTSAGLEPSGATQANLKFASFNPVRLQARGPA